jgi:4-amino-4-deoxy-L-arabinose transferase-like glycosyltransferase
LVILVMVLRALTPPHAYDEAIYHLAAVKRFVEAGSLTPLYDIAQGNTHMLVHMLYAPCLMFGADSATRLLSVGFALLTALALYAYAVRFFNRSVGYFAALAFFGAGMIVEVAITARIDVTLAGFLFLSTYGLTVYLEERLRAWLWLSAVFSGIAVGIKLTGLLWVALLGCVYLVQTLYKSSSAERLAHLRRGVLYFLIVVALVSPWLLKNYAYFHNPLYPFASSETVTGQRGQPAAHFGPAEEAKLESYFQKAKERNPTVAGRIERHPLEFWGYFTDPDLYNLAEPFHAPNYLFLVCPLFLLFGRDRKLLWLALCCVVFFVVMVSFAWTARYLVPLYPPLTLMAAYVVVRSTEWLKRKNAIAIAIPLVALLLTTGGTLLVEGLQLARTRELNYINGSMSRADFLSQSFYYPSLRYVNETAGPEAKVFMMGAQMGYDLQRPFVADTTWSSTPWRRLLLRADTPEGVRDAMKAEGITHVIYFPHMFEVSTMTGNLGLVNGSRDNNGRPDYYEQWRNWTTFEEVRKKYLDQVYEDKFGYTVYTLR